ncbi:capsular biosynthesis protein, partial [Campylobacter jejuni]|nr:capsular biosynthesis protein [Campylobacter jejuni]EDN5980176.1 capsular biosynthesis protein [Campylobacter jejuni]EGG1579740.1 capsular biosynthesis protein [Campylobacter jejuni]EGO3142675.1 capsular biosynthesis protein [Campylobacter jejuni]EGP2381981.1 capsular biosynthesis protein [Campylobacter jejuni]
MIDNLFSIKQQIKKAIQYWKFDLAEYIYETNYLNYKELKVEYVYFLIQTGQLNKIIFLFQDEQDNFLIEKCYFLKQDINLKQLIFYLKNIDNLIIGNIDFSNL